MKTIFTSALVVAGMSVSLNCMAADLPAEAAKYNCTGCHAIDKKMVGPGWKAVADKYKGDKGARDKLIAKMIKGGGGVWGPMPMPASPKMSNEESAKLVDFILKL